MEDLNIQLGNYSFVLPPDAYTHDSTWFDEASGVDVSGCRIDVYSANNMVVLGIPFLLNFNAAFDLERLVMIFTIDGVNAPSGVAVNDVSYDYITTGFSGVAIFMTCCGILLLIVFITGAVCYCKHYKKQNRLIGDIDSAPSESQLLNSK